MATGPQPGDLIIRNTANEHFEVFAVDGKHLAGPSSRSRPRMPMHGSLPKVQTFGSRCTTIA